MRRMPAWPSWRTPSGCSGPPRSRQTSTSGRMRRATRLMTPDSTCSSTLDVEQRVAADDPAQPAPDPGPQGHVDHARLILECQEDGALGGHGVLPRDHQPADGDPPRPALGQLPERQRAQPLERRPVQLHDLVPGVEREDGVGIAEPLQLARRRQCRRRGRRQADVQRPLPGGSRAERTTVGPAACSTGDLAQLPQRLPPRLAQRVQRTGTDEPLQRPPRTAPSAPPGRPASGTARPRARAASSRSPSASPMPLTRCSPRRMP